MQPDGPEQSGQPRAYAPPPQSYGQAAHGHSSYGPPNGRPAGRSPGIIALVLALAGAAVAAVGLLGVRWTKVPDLGDSLTQPKFLTLRRLFVALSDADGSDQAKFTIAYFEWAAFVLLGAALLFAILAALPTSATPAFRVLGTIAGLLSAAAALFAPALDDTTGLSDYLGGGLGLYLVAGGSVLMAAGSLIGSRKRS